jgi:crossover junction endodeoxyribonuclease RuvC
MLTLGIDPGTATTGYGFLRENQDGSLNVIEYGVITTPKNQEMPERLLELFQQLNQLILLHRPESAAVEKLFFQRNVRTALSVGQGRGVVLLAMAQAKIPVAEYTPLEVKQAVVGYGGAEKSQVQEMVRAILELQEIPKPDDAADALAIAICHIHSSRYKSLGAL